VRRSTNLTLSDTLVDAMKDWCADHDISLSDLVQELLENTAAVMRATEQLKANPRVVGRRRSEAKREVVDIMRITP
jgi:hypothetical protein